MNANLPAYATSLARFLARAHSADRAARKARSEYLAGGEGSWRERMVWQYLSERDSWLYFLSCSEG